MRILITIGLLFFYLHTAAADISVLVYHDIEPNDFDSRFTVRLSDFHFQMRYLKKNGYHPISLQYLRKVQQGKAKLPKKAVILTFDDGLKSYRKYAVPILKRYKFPSVVSVVTNWMDGRNIPEEYRGKIMTAKEVKSVSREPLVEVISHSHNMHYGVLANPQGNKAAVAITRIYNPGKKRYESEQSVKRRVERDLVLSRKRLQAVTGKAPIAIAWPYGHYNQQLVNITRKLGIIFQLILDERPTRLDDLPRISRTFVLDFESQRDFVDVLRFQKYWGFQRRFAEISLDPFIGKSHETQEQILSALIRRIELLGVNSVVVTPFSEDGRYAFFYNRKIPVRHNILNRILHQLRVRNDVMVYVKLPLYLKKGATEIVYKDLARLNYFHGVIFTGKSDLQHRKHLAKLIHIIQYYHPTAEFGLASASLPADLAFRYYRQNINVPSMIFRREMKKAAKSSRPVYVILVDHQNNPDLLVKRMRTMRSIGIADFGFTDKTFNQDQPAAIVIGPEIRQRSYVDRLKR